MLYHCVTPASSYALAAADYTQLINIAFLYCLAAVRMLSLLFPGNMFIQAVPHRLEMFKLCHSCCYNGKSFLLHLLKLC